MVLRSFWRQNQLHGTHSFQENTILVNQFGWYKIIMANFQCVLSHYCTSFHETIYKGTNTCEKWLRFKVKDADIEFKTMLINVNKSANNNTRVSKQSTSDFRLKAVDNDRATILAQVPRPQLTRIQLTHWTPLYTMQFEDTSTVIKTLRPRQLEVR